MAIFSRLVVEDFEKTISEVLAERNRAEVCHEIEKEKISGEKLQIMEDLRAAERSFNDVHRYK